MFEPRIPEAPEVERITGPLEFPTVLLLLQVSEGYESREHGERLPVELEFEYASRIGLAPALRRHRPGKPVTGAGGTPVLDWAICSGAHRADARDTLRWAPGFYSMSESFARDLLTPLVLWVQDLPASESHHHSHPYGLLDHMLEVALAAMAECLSKLDDRPVEAALPFRRYEKIARLAGILGLVHDIGKVFSVEVKDSKSGETWDPMREPLAYFKARHKVPILEPTVFRFLAGRGFSGHESQGRDVLPLVIHPKIWKRTGSEISNSYEAYLGRHGTEVHSGPLPLDFIAECARNADRTSTMRSIAKGSKPGDYLRELVANQSLEG